MQQDPGSLLVNTIFIIEVSKDLLEYDHFTNNLYYENLIKQLMEVIKSLRKISDTSDYSISISLIFYNKVLHKIMQNINVKLILEDVMKHHIHTSVTKIIKDCILINSNLKETEHALELLESQSKSNSKRRATVTNMFIDIYHNVMKQYHGKNRVVYFMNFRGKSMLIKDEGIYKIIDDFRKLKVFEVDCAPSMRDLKTTQGNIRFANPGNAKLVAQLGGNLLDVGSLNYHTLKEHLNFSQLAKRSAKIRSMNAYFGLSPEVNLAELLGSQASCPQLSEVTSYEIRLQQCDTATFESLRYSCGWKKVDETADGFMYFLLDHFDCYLVYQMKRVEMETPCPGLGHWQVRLFAPANVKEAKKSAYDIIKEEAKVWDEILHLCEKLNELKELEDLKEYISSHKEPIKRLQIRVNDQKSTK